ncbi:MAG TPA: hypothetical protein H9881_08845 [Candidatus Stackebrandtia excrementipullorum]|nr:hypothetical protein [Candidatus Stackebrandtia excrementipullorum]
MSKDTRSFEEDRSPEKSDSDKLNGLQIVAATGAATTAAVVATALGIYGTVIGVAVFSVISSAGTAVFLQSMNRTRDRLRKTAHRDAAGPHEQPPADEAVTAPIVAPLRPGALPAPDTNGSDAQEEQPVRVRGTRRVRWHAVAVTSVIVFVLSLGVLTGLALMSGQAPTAFYGNSPTPAVSTPTKPAELEPGDYDDNPPPPSTSEETETSSPSEPEDENSPSEPTVSPSEPDPSTPSGDPDESPAPEEPGDPEEE